MLRETEKERDRTHGVTKGESEKASVSEEGRRGKGDVRREREGDRQKTLTKGERGKGDGKRGTEVD